MVTSAETDAATCASSTGYELEWLLRQPLFQRAEVARNGCQPLVEWVFDSAFRFFPVERDGSWPAGGSTCMGCRHKQAARAHGGAANSRGLSGCAFLPPASPDAWVPFAGRPPARIRELHPFMILQEMPTPHAFSSGINSSELQLPRIRWICYSGSKHAGYQPPMRRKACCNRLSAEEVGCLYLDASGKPVTPDTASAEFSTLRRHYGSVRGAWPIILRIILILLISTFPLPWPVECEAYSTGPLSSYHIPFSRLLAV